MASRIAGASRRASGLSNRRLYIWKITGAPVSWAACSTPSSVSRLYTLKAGMAHPRASPRAKMVFRSVFIAVSFLSRASHSMLSGRRAGTYLQNSRSSAV